MKANIRRTVTLVGGTASPALRECAAGHRKIAAHFLKFPPLRECAVGHRTSYKTVDDCLPPGE